MDHNERWKRPGSDAASLSLAACSGGLVVVLTLGAGALRSADALPPGKAWSAVIDTLKIPGHTYGIVPRRLEPDTLGRPLAFVEAQGGIGRDMYVLRWEDSTWTSVAHLGYGTKGVNPVPSPAGTHHLIWSGLEEIEPEVRSYLVMSEFAGDSLSRPDTVTSIYAGSLKYTAAASMVRRWAAASDNGDLRLLYADALAAWIEVPVGGTGDRGVAVATLDDTTALVVWRDRFVGPGTGILRGSTWTLANAPPMTGLVDAAPRLRPRPSGGHWLSWATIDDYVGIASYRDGVWSPPESIRCAYLRPEVHYSQSAAAMSRDDGEYPAISWMAVSSRNGLTSVCVCVPGDSGFTVAENLAGSEGGEGGEVARDRNQDVWVVWEAPARGMGWAHTYTRATSSAPTVTGAGSKRFVSWTLSEPAAGTWWAVLRARDADPFEVAARVRAGNTLAMNWTDLSPPAGTLRYRIRRECMDKQYEWLSDEALWPVDVPPNGSQGPVLALIRASSNPADAVLRFELLNASAGPLDVQVYDLRGRLLLRQRPTATGNGRDSILVDLAATTPTAGLYFLRVADASGKVSPVAKIVYLR